MAIQVAIGIIGSVFSITGVSVVVRLWQALKKCRFAHVNGHLANVNSHFANVNGRFVHNGNDSANGHVSANVAAANTKTLKTKTLKTAISWPGLAKKRRYAYR